MENAPQKKTKLKTQDAKPRDNNNNNNILYTRLVALPSPYFIPSVPFPFKFLILLHCLRHFPRAFPPYFPFSAFHLQHGGICNLRLSRVFQLCFFLFFVFLHFLLYFCIFVYLLLSWSRPGSPEINPSGHLGGAWLGYTLFCVCDTFEKFRKK